MRERDFVEDGRLNRIQSLTLPLRSNSVFAYLLCLLVRFAMIRRENQILLV